MVCANGQAMEIMHAALEKPDIDRQFQLLNVLIVEDNQFMRKVIRMLLTNVVVKNVHEASDGLSALEQIRHLGPDLVILDWELPLLTGSELVRIVRSPGVFPFPDIPIIVVSGHGERRRVVEAAALGINEYLVKPVSAKALRDRMVAVMTRPRPNVTIGDYYGPMPRNLIGHSLTGPEPLEEFPEAALAS